MLKRVIILLLLILIAAASWYAHLELEWPTLRQIMQSAAWLAVLYAVMGIGLRTFILKKVKDAKNAYRFRKTAGIIFYIIAILILFRVWIENPEALLVSYGIVAAGAAIALQDLIKNMAGGIVVILNNLFRVGDRIQIENTFGDVIDVGMLNTTMFEIGNWVDGDQATGRLTTVPNGVFLSKPVVNYTRDHEYIWDEVMIPITYQSDWKKASKVFTGIAERRTKEFIEPADRQLKTMARKFYVTERNTFPSVFVRPTDNWIEIHLRFITRAKERRIVANDIRLSILKSIERHDDIDMASQTIDIVGFPGT